MAEDGKKGGFGAALAKIGIGMLTGAAKGYVENKQAEMAQPQGQPPTPGVPPVAPAPSTLSSSLDAIQSMASQGPKQAKLEDAVDADAVDAVPAIQTGDLSQQLPPDIPGSLKAVLNAMKRVPKP